MEAVLFMLSPLLQSDPAPTGVNGSVSTDFSWVLAQGLETLLVNYTPLHDL